MMFAPVQAFRVELVCGLLNCSRQSSNSLLIQGETSFLDFALKPFPGGLTSDRRFALSTFLSLSSEMLFLLAAGRARCPCWNGWKDGYVGGFWNNFFAHVPIELDTLERHMID